MPNRFTLTERLEQLWESDEELLLHLKPNLDLRIYGHPEFSFTVKTNEDGLRDEFFAGTYDIAAIGDSFTFGFGVEEPDSWPARLESLSGARVANLGWAGWSSYVYPAAIRRHAIPLRAKKWIWSFFGNDLPESAGAAEFLSTQQTDYKTWALQSGTGNARLSFPFSLKTLQLIAALFNPELFLLPDSGDRIIDNGELRMRAGLYPWKTTDPTQPEVQLGWELTEDALIEAQQLALAHDATLIVVYVPYREHVYWPYIQDWMKDVDVRQLDEVEARLATICKQHNINYLNLLPGFRAQALDGKMLYFPSDGHWNEAGHDLAAWLIHDKLLQEGLWP